MVGVISSIGSKESHKLNTLETYEKEQQKAEQTYKILQAVRENQPINLYQLERVTGTAHTTLFFIMRSMEFAGLVYSKKRIDQQNRIVRLFYTTKKNLNSNKTKEPVVNSTGLNNSELKGDGGDDK